MTGQRYIDIGIDDGGTETLLPATHFGPRGFENDLPAEYRQSQGDKVMELTYNWDTSTDDYTAEQDSSRLIIPTGAWIVGAYVTCLVPQDGTTTVSLVGADTNNETVAIEAAMVAQTAVGQVTDLSTAVPQLVPSDSTIYVEANAMTVGEATLTLIYRTPDDRTGTQS